nr:hypothetical protein [Pseudomonas sp. R3-18-08]
MHHQPGACLRAVGRLSLGQVAEFIAVVLRLLAELCSASSWPRVL